LCAEVAERLTRDLLRHRPVGAMGMKLFKVRHVSTLHQAAQFGDGFDQTDPFKQRKQFRRAAL
jgi:hypothetical protein